jgi:hypothetical protein
LYSAGIIGGDDGVEAVIVPMNTPASNDADALPDFELTPVEKCTVGILGQLRLDLRLNNLGASDWTGPVGVSVVSDSGAVWPIDNLNLETPSMSVSLSLGIRAELGKEHVIVITANPVPESRSEPLIVEKDYSNNETSVRVILDRFLPETVGFFDVPCTPA